MTDYFRALLADADMMFALFLAVSGTSVLLIFMLWPAPKTENWFGATEAAGISGMFWVCLYFGLYVRPMAEELKR